MTAALEGGEWSAARPGRTLPQGKTRYSFYRRLDGPQDRSGRAENLVPTGIRSRTVQPLVSRYTDWATGPTIKYFYFIWWLLISAHLPTMYSRVIFFIYESSFFRISFKTLLKVSLIYVRCLNIILKLNFTSRVRLAIRIVPTALTQHRSMVRDCSGIREHRWTIMTKDSRISWRRICLRIILSTINPTRKGLTSNPVLLQVLTAWTIPKRTFYPVCRKCLELI